MEGTRSDVDIEKYDFICQTVQSNAIKTLAESLKDVLTDANMKLSSKGIEILTVNQPSAIVHLKLLEGCFETFYCSHDFIIGLNIKSLYTFLKTISNNDVVTLSVEKADTTRLVIEIENHEKKIKDTSRLRLLDIDDDEYHIDGIDFDRIIKMPSTDFQKICKELNNISDTIKIEIDGETFKMSVDGEIGEKEVIIRENADVKMGDDEIGEEIAVNRNTDINVSETYALKYLLSFVKSSNLCPTVQILIKEKYPLVLIYSVGQLGTLKFLLFPFHKPV